MIGQVTSDQLAALDRARNLAERGIPLFLAQPDSSVSTGYLPPKGWERSTPDPSVVDAWRPDLALCAVMGHGLDVIDIDPRNGGKVEMLADVLPRFYAVAHTPSSGMHIYIRSLGVAKATNLFPGIDIQAGAPDGSGRGFVFLPPTIRRSRTSGELVAYDWSEFNLVDEYWWNEMPSDASGDKLADLIRKAKAGAGVVKAGGPDWWQAFVQSNEPQSHLAADRAISDKLREVESWSSVTGVGFRTTILRAAMTLGGYVGGGYLDEAYARSALAHAAGAVWGSADTDDELWIDQGIEDGKARPFHVYYEDNPLSRSNIAGFDPKGWLDQELGGEALEVLEPAARFAQDAGTWVVRDADRWVERKKYEASAVAALGEVMPLGDPDLPRNKEDYTEDNWRFMRRKRFLSSGTSGAIERKMVALAGIVGSRYGVSIAKLDNNAEILWAGQYAWDLRASADRPTYASGVSLDTPHMHAAQVAPDMHVSTPHWDRFVQTVLPDPEIRDWALRVLSIGLTGYADAALPILYGRERSGKTSLVEILMEVFGSYGRAANPGLINPDYGGHDVIIYDLKGVRLAFIDEGPKRGHKSTERLKQITGGGSLTASQKGANPITFRPTHTLVLTTNLEPELTDPALRARARIIPCNADEAEVWPARAPLLDPAVLSAEAPGILAQMMRHAALWLADRQSTRLDSAPAAVLTATTEIAENQDPVRDWVTECTVPSDPGTPGRRLFKSFAEWHQGNPLYKRMSIPSETSFGRTLTDMGYPATKMVDGRYRPLSVLGGPGYTYTTPTPSEYLAGRVPVAFDDGSSGLPGSPEKTTSDPVFSSSSVGLSSSIHIENREKEKREVNNRETATERGTIPGNLGRPVQPVSAPHLTSGNSISVPGNLVGKTRQKPSEGPLSPERAAVARIADETGVTKAEARRLVKEQARLEAIAEAQGDVLALPAVVDRAQHTLPVSVEQARQILDACLARSEGHLTVDVETTGYPVGHVHYALRTVQLGDDQAAVVLCPTEHVDTIREYLDKASVLHAHSATADLVPLHHDGIYPAAVAWPKMHDTVIPAKLADPQSTGSDPALKKLSEVVIGKEAVSPQAEIAKDNVFKVGKWLKRTEADTPVEKSGWAQIDRGCEVMLRYAASDVLDTAALAKRLPKVPDVVYTRERIAQDMTARAAHRGFKLDHPRISELYSHHQSEQGKWGYVVTGYGIENPGSGPQVSAKLIEMGANLPISEKGNPSVAEHVLTKVKGAGGPASLLADAVLNYRHSSTVLSLFLDPYRLICELGDGRARPTVYTLGTDTGRMSCVRPNFQQLPREGGIRSVVVADPGMSLISADFSGVELRGAAALSQDATMMHMIREEDEGRFDGFHWAVARQAFGPDATKADRYVAKRGVFGHIYGGGITTLAQQVGVPESHMAAIVDSLKTLTPGLAQWSEGIRQAVREGRTQFPSYSGRVIHFPRAYPHKAPNYAIQGSCRELLVDALVRWRDTKWGTCTVLPIHDELIVQVPEEDVVPATETLVQCMESTLYGVKIVADPGKREEWGSPFWRDAS